MYVVSAGNLSVSFGTDRILEKVSFALEENARLGVIGVNGCGKSTLFRLLAGKLEPTTGTVTFSKGATVGLLEQDDAFQKADESRTVSEQILRAFSPLLEMEAQLAELQSRMDAGDKTAISAYSSLHERYLEEGGLTFRSRSVSILEKLGFDASARGQTVGSLSGGQRTRLALAIELSKQPDLLLLDEPTNHLDIETLSWLESFLLSYPRAFAVISHDRYFLDRVTTKTLSITYGQAKLYAGGYTKSMEQRRIDREIAERHWKNQQKEIARQEAYIAQQRAWNRERNVIAAESRQKLLDKMERIERPKEDPKGIRMQFSESLASGGNVWEARDLSFGYGNRPALFSHLDFQVKRGDRVFLIGPNGCGKSTLVKLLLGKLQPTGGVLETGYHVEIGYYDQENRNLTESSTVLGELHDAYPTKTETELRNLLALFCFRGESVFRTVSMLSGGERTRLSLAKLMLSKSNVLLLDEPTNHLDMDAREALETALETYQGTVLIVTHDRYFAEKCATRIFWMKPGEPFRGDLLDFRVGTVGHGYTELTAYREPRQAEALPEKAGEERVREAPSTQKEQYLQAKAAAAAERKQKARTEKLTAECRTLEQELTEVETLLYGTEGTDYQKVIELDARRGEIESRLLEIYEELESFPGLF